MDTTLFDTKYSEFARDLQGACPELTDTITAALALSSDERRKQFKEQVLPFCSPSRKTDAVPTFVLPGVSFTQDLWDTVSSRSKKVIQEYLSVLSFTFLLDTGSSSDIPESGWDAAWASKMMDDMKSKLDGFDFSAMAEKFAKLFGSAASGGAGAIPQLPEKFMNGQIAKLAEEIVKEIRMEDFGLSPADMEAAGKDPTKALNMIMSLLMKNPQILQGTMQKLGKKLQAKIQSGSIRPQELVAEAEELMKMFSDNPQFTEMMDSFRKAFGFEDKTTAQAAGRDNENRLSIARNRLRKKLEAKKAGKR